MFSAGHTCLNNPRMACNSSNADSELAAINEILSAGVVQSSMDGQTVTFDLNQLEKRKRELQNQSLTALANNYVRPPMMRVTFSRFQS